MPEPLQLVIRTPHAVVLDAALDSARVPTRSGAVGLRPRQEPFVLAVEPGLLLLHAGDGAPRYAATAGGLLEAERARAVLYTPFAVTGDDGDALLQALDAVLRTPDSELAARKRLGELEQRIVGELRHEPAGARPRSEHG